MDLVKRGRQKVTVGDCVSINSDFFGEVYAKAVGVERIIGRVTKVNGIRDFDVVWDYDDDDETKHMNLEKVTLEARDTPKQQLKKANPSPTVITADDFQPSEQGTSKEASTSHALLVEDFDTVADDNMYILLSNDKRLFLAKMYSAPPGTIVHHRALLESERKFLITEVLDTTWDGFKEDTMCVGSFIAWKVKDTAVVVENEEVASKKTKKRKFVLKLNLKEKVREEEEDDEEEEQEESKTDESSEDEYVERIKRVGRRNARRGGKKGVGKTTKKKQEVKRRKIEKERQKKVGEQQEKAQENVQEKTVEDRSNRRKKSLGNANRGKRVENIINNKDKDKEDTVSSSSESDDDEEDKDEKKKAEKLEEQKSKWKEGGWTIDPCERHSFGPKLHLEAYEMVDELGYLLHFLPVSYIQDVIIPAANDLGLKNVANFQIISYEEFIIFLCLVYSMEIVKLPERRMYWRDNQSDLFPNMEFGKHMSRNRFEEILAYLQFSFAEDKTQQVLDFLEAVNKNLDAAVSAGQYVCIDESMIKAFHHDLPGKIKIKRKPRPIGNEVKDMSDATSMIVIRMELYEGKDPMSTKEYVKEYGATCATTLRLAESIKSSGRIVIGDSWFGSVKTVVQLRKIGLYAIMLVKTAHALFPKELLNSHKLARGEWVGYTSTVDDVELMATSFQDLKKKQFVSTCESVVPGKPRVTKHHGNVARPKVAETYLKHADSIDKHNSFRTGSLGLEDVLHTHSPHLRMFFGLTGFLFTNAYLAFRFFKPEQKDLKHLSFKMALAESMIKFQLATRVSLRLPVAVAIAPNVDEIHKLVKLPYQKPCYYCRHGYPVSQKINTTFKCSAPSCKMPIHKPHFVLRKKDGTTKELDCWKLHITHGKPQFRRVMNE